MAARAVEIDEEGLSITTAGSTTGINGQARRGAAFVGPRVWLSLLAAFFAILAPTARASAQDYQNPLRVWGAFGLGGVSAPVTDGMGVMGEIAVQKYPHHAAFRVLAIADAVNTSAGPKIGEFAALYGRTAIAPAGHAAIASGLALTGGDLCKVASTDAQCQDSWTVGIPIVAELALQPLPVVGVGVQAFANLNTKASFFGGIVFLQLGWMP
jgi:hypothetical protein